MNQGLVAQYSYAQQNPSYKGEPFESSLAQGPTEDRKCRDCLFLLLYLAFWVGLIVVAIIAFTNGQPHLLASPFDSTGQQCGYSTGYQDYPYGYFNQKNTKQFACINTCPTSGLTSQSKCFYNNSELNCNTFGNYTTTTFVGICYPDSDIIAETINLGIGFFEESISDMETTWPISLSVVFITLILSLLLMFLIRVCGGCLVIGTIILYFASIITIAVIFLLTAEGQIQIVGLDDLQDPDLLYAISGISFGVAAISFIILLCSIRKIKIGIMVLKATAQFTQQEFQTILVPVFMFIAIALFIAFWITVSIFIFSSGSIGHCDGSPYACIDWDNGVKRSLGFYFFGLFWNCQVAIGVSQFVIASTASYWYFSHGKNKQQVSSPVCKSFYRALFYHLGSIAFGALILCILWILQIFLQILHGCVKQKTVAGNPVTGACAGCCIACARCCLACFQRFVRFISHNAFIMMAITGEGFCTSAHQAFYLVMRSTAEYAITHGVGHLIMFFGKLLIATLCTLAGYFMITQISYFSAQLFTPVMPTIIFFVISFVIGSVFMDVFGVGSDTLLLCYCLEKDVLRGVSRCCPQKLKETLDN